jgi:hypothetical protein
MVSLKDADPNSFSDLMSGLSQMLPALRGLAPEDFQKQLGETNLLDQLNPNTPSPNIPQHILDTTKCAYCLATGDLPIHCLHCHETRYCNKKCRMRDKKHPETCVNRQKALANHYRR